MKNVSSVLAGVAGMAPGMLLPFVIALALGPMESGVLVLAFSATTALINIFANTVEQNTVGEYGRFLGAGNLPTGSAWRSYARRTMTFSAIGTLVGFPILTITYGALLGDFSAFLSAAAPLLLVPVVAGFGSIYAGASISDGRVVPVLLVQSFRSIFPLLALIGGVRDLSIVATCMLLGELTRCTFLFLRRRRTKPDHGDSAEAGELLARGLWWQAGSMATSQAGSVVDRGFLALAPPGAVVQYEMADKITFAAVQLLVSGFLLRMVGGWSRLLNDREQLTHRVVRDVVRLILASCLAVIGGLLSLLGLLWSGLLPASWAGGAQWGLLALIGVPASVLMMASSRLIVLLRAQSALIFLVVFGLLSNLVFNFVFFPILGAFGILVSTVISRFLGAVAYVATGYVYMRKGNS